MLKVALTTLGCKVNQFESAALLTHLGDVSIVSFGSRADCYIVNTCTVTGRTDYQSRQLIRRAHRLNPQAPIIVTGCYAQTAPAEISRLPGVAAVVGNGAKERIPEIIRALCQTPSPAPQLLVTDIRGEEKIASWTPRSYPGHTRAFLRIQDGCDAFCTYCIVPYARGRSRSLPAEEVLRQIFRLYEGGYREIVLTGIHLGAFGQDLSPQGNLLEILERLEGRLPQARLRLSSLEPKEISPGMIRFLAGSRMVCPHLHIPLQSGDGGILEAMGRDYDAPFFRDLIGQITGAMPDAAIGIDVMAGFPGEDDGAFENTFSLIEGLPIAYCHVFPYSRRPGTPAAAFRGQVRPEVIKERAGRLRDMSLTKREAFASRFLGRRTAVLVEAKRDRATGLYKGFSEHYIPVMITNGDQSYVNQIAPVVPESLQGGQLVGRAVPLDGPQAGQP